MKKHKKINYKSDFTKNQLSSSLELGINDPLKVEKWLYTRKETIKIFQISLVTLRSWKLKKILLPIPPIGGKIYYTRNSILELIDPNTNQLNIQ